MAEKYPPLEATESDKLERTMPAELAERFDGSAPHQFARDAYWVFENFDIDDEAAAKFAPSPGAWTLLQHARRNPTWFYTKYLMKYAFREQQAAEPESEILEEDLRMAEEMLNDMPEDLARKLKAHDQFKETRTALQGAAPSKRAPESPSDAF